MDLRNLSFRLNFEGSASPILKMDDAVDGLKKSVGGATSNLDGMGKTLKNDIKTDSIDKLGRSTEKLGKTSEAAAKKGNHSIDSVKNKLSSLQKSTEVMGKKLMTTITLPLIAIGTAGVKMALDVDKGIRKVSTLADRNILPVDKIKQGIREISDASGIAQTEIAESTYSALSAGIKSEQVFSFVRSGIDLTRAGFTDMETVIDATTTVLNAYGEKAYDVSTIHDMFVQTQDKGKISVDELGKNIGKVIPTASSLGVNLNQLGASYSILTSKGQNARIATTNLNSMLDELGKSGSNADKILRETTGKGFAGLIDKGKHVGDALEILDKKADSAGKSLKDMFGSGSAGDAAVTLMAGGVDGSFNDYVNLMDGATGKTAENAEKMEDGWLKIQKAANATKNSLIDAGAVIAPYVEMAAEKISGLVEKFNRLDEGTKSNMLKFVGLAAAMGPALKIGTMLMRAVGFGITAFTTISGAIVVVSTGAVAATPAIGALATVFTVLTGPIGLAIGAVTALTIAGVALYKNWGTISEWGKKWWNEQKEGWENAKNNTINAWNGMVDGISNAIGKIKEKAQGLKDFFKNPIKGTIELGRNFVDKYKPQHNPVDGSHATGLNKVPKDNYVGNLHKDEMILTKATSDKFRALGGTKDNVPVLAGGKSEVTNNNYTDKEKTVEKIETKTERGNVLFNPVYNITLKGTATENDKQEIEKVIDRKTRELFNIFFKEMNMKLA